MKIKRLEIYGFKSFPKRVILAFPKGISVIVGPNGSGKSNIVDAIRWVLGEQNPRRLRVREMTDLIFVSQNQHGPNFAEVRLILENEEKSAPKEFMHLSEIVITRRLYKNGETEYFINNRPCRLKDITYLFLDTGVHPRAYGIIDQGQVGQFVEQSPKERRNFLEELAGILRYKMRREETVRQLSRTRENLIRLKDILIEVETRKKELELQAEEAQNYICLQEKLKNLEIKKLAIIFKKTNKKKIINQEKLTKEKNFLEELLDYKKKIDPEYDELTAKLELVRIEIEEKEILYKDKEKTFRQISNEFSKLLKKEVELAKTAERTETDLINKKEKFSILKDRIKEIYSAKKEINYKLQELEKELIVIKNQNECFYQEEKNFERDISIKEKTFLEIKTKKEQLKERLKNNQESLRKILLEKEEIQKKLSTIIEIEKNLTKEKKKLLENLNILEKEQQNIQSQLTENQKALEEVNLSKEKIYKELTTLSMKIRELEHEKALLEKFLEKEALPKAVQLLKKAGFEVKTLADLLTFTSEKEHLIERVLDQTLTAVVVENKEKILKIASFLKKNGLACQILWPKQGVQTFVIKRLAEVTEVTSLEDALLCKQKAFTPDGFEVDPEGLISYCPNKQKLGILSKRRRLEEIKIQLSILSKKKKELSIEGEKICKKISTLEKLIENNTQKLEKISTKKEEIEYKIKELEFKEKSLFEKKHFFETRLYEIQEEIKVLLKNKKNLEESVKDLEENEAILIKEIENFKKQLLKIKDSIKSGLSRERSLEVEISITKEKLNQIKAEEKRLLKKETLLSQEINNLSESLLKSKNQIDVLRNKISKFSKDIKQLEREIDKLLKELEEKRILAKNLENKLIEISSKREKILKNISQVKEYIHRKEIDLSEIELTISHIKEQAKERFNIEIEKISTEQENLNKIESEIKSIKEKLREFPAVNLAAIDELKRINERYNFLLTQCKDLEKAILDLEQAVKHINQTCRKRLKNTLEEANQKLRLVFPLLLPNGEAKLKFVYSEDPLEAGLDLEVKLPGKPVRHLAMLSGGEKAMTALAVLCAFYLVKPGPFCVLDEVDSSLDETSVQRFRNLLKELEKYSQIILVTHNKQVMEVADVLFGVTMEEKGISKLVTAKLT